VPERRCALTRRTADRQRLVRFVADPDGRIVADVVGRLPGRGIWLCAERDVVNTACARGVFGRALRARVVASDDLADRVEALLARRCVETIALARRAGEVAAGFEKVRALLAADGAGVLAIAGDCVAADARRLARMATGVPEVRALRAAEMAGALGREHVVYVAVRTGRLAERLAVDGTRLAGFRQGHDDEAPGARSGKGQL